MRRQARGLLARSLYQAPLVLAALLPPAALSGCGDKQKENGTLAPPVQDDYGKVMEDFMKKNPPQQK